MNLPIFSRLCACFAGPFPEAKAGAFAYNPPDTEGLNAFLITNLDAPSDIDTR